MLHRCAPPCIVCVLYTGRAFSRFLSAGVHVYIYIHTRLDRSRALAARVVHLFALSRSIYIHTRCSSRAKSIFIPSTRARVLGYICRLLARTRAPGDDLALSGRELQPAIPPVAAVLSAVCISICRCACKGASDLFPPRGDSLGVCRCTPIAGFSPRVYFRNAVFGNRSLRFTLSLIAVYIPVNH